MITLADVKQAIIECFAVRNPDANTCRTLAALITIQEYLSEKNEQEDNQQDERTKLPSYSYDSGEQVEKTIDYYSDTEFSHAIDGRNAYDIWQIMDELMTVLQATNTRLYDGVMRKIEN